VGQTSDEIYEGYRLLTGVSHMLPRAVYGYIQSKAIYPTEQQTPDVSKEYREKKLPLDRELHAMDVNTLLSVWPHFSQGTQFYDMLLSKGWLVHTSDGKPDSGGFKDVIGPNIDITNPEAAK
jgi:alpha-glucosidase/alpha-D-xyloside xylohydrolase